ncbi:MAG: hypothetical protein RBQ95_02780 [Paracholeplasma sp.]|jgi:hypothetical protein|uniref:hypothetical protein n=1 Tax=Acholeplasma brassicae TaxID=61635 RepID=UPI000AB86378|nr:MULTISPECIES: hypothetical protein [Paracholeplasma]MDY3195761.1 hypothetical protein [Paracholeplasma sp.]
MAQTKDKKSKNVQSQAYQVPVIKDPSKTLWGRIVVYVLVAAMIVLPVVALIIAIATKK